jgi:glucosyl-dolichyl phosphate glucuronosyltransferase
MQYDGNATKTKGSCVIDGVESSPVPVTVLIASRNGAKWIARVLDAYADQAEDCPWQLVVVNNNSTDNTRQIVESYREKLPITIVDEPVAGKNRALNAGLPYVTGELVITPDDDAIPHPGFLTGWIAAAARFPDHDLFGGRIIAHFDGNPPRWILRLAKESKAAFSQRDFPEGDIEATEIFGPNMAVRRRVFDSGLIFDEKVGPNALDPNYPTGSETDFLRRAAAAGRHAAFVEGPTVNHIVRPNQTSMAFFRAQALRDGRSGAMLDRKSGTLRSAPWDERKLMRMVPATAQLATMWLRAALQPDMVQRSFKWWGYEWWRGYISEARKP